MSRLIVSTIGLGAVLGVIGTFALDRPGVASADSMAAKAGGKGAVPVVSQLQRLSFDLRLRPLSVAEREQIETELSSESGDVVYRRYVESWLNRAAIKRFVGAFFKFPPAVVEDATADSFFHRLARRGKGKAAVYYLPSKAPKSGPACKKGAIKTVRAWWSKKPVRICESSYVPQKVFDKIGYCSGGAEPLMEQLPRAGCGCGPMLMGCLPPKGEFADLDAMVKSSVMDEWFESAARIVTEDRPLDELVTTTRTWQNGFAEFLYARRDVLGVLARHGWTRNLDRKIQTWFSAIDIRRPARWVDRGGPYKGSGLWWTALAPQAYKMPVRPVAHSVLTTYLCSEFHAVNVDATAILASVGKDNANLRTLSSITESPMRSQKGCKGCHSPMDGAGGFLGEIQTPLFGSYPTMEKARGEFFVSGDRDFRGKGAGIAAFAKMIVAQPEFETCSVRTAFEAVMKRPVQSADLPFFQELITTFQSNGHRWEPIVRTLLESDTYRGEMSATQAPPPPVDKVGEVPKVVADIVNDVCSNCHDENSALDLSKMPKATDVETWKKILTKVSDLTMPPPSKDAVSKESVTSRFPMDPSVRRKFTGALTAMLGPALDGAQDPLRMNHGTWMAVVHEVGDPVITSQEIDAIARPFAERARLFLKTPRGLPPPYKVAVDRISDQVCRRVAETDAGAEKGKYGITNAKGAWAADKKAKSAWLLLGAIYSREISRGEVKAAIRVLDEAHAVTGSWNEAWAALCSIHLSGPKLLFDAMRGQ